MEDNTRDAAAAPASPPATAGATADKEFLSDRAVTLMALACAASVANGYYIQPLLVEVGGSLAAPENLLGLLPALTQIGVALGVLFLLPLADILSARLLLLAAIPVQMAGLLLAAASGNGVVLAAACLLIGLAGVTPYVLPPYASSRVRPAELGRVTGLLTRGVIVGILLGRMVAGVVGDHLGWRAVYGMALVVTVGVLEGLRHLVRPVPAVPRAGVVGYRGLLLSTVRLVRTVPALRAAAACQALSFGSFNVFWLGVGFHLQGPAFGWSLGAVGSVAVLGALAALPAPFFGRMADLAGAHRARTLSLAAMAFAWVVLALFRHSLVGMAVGLVVLNVGATVADIASRTILYRLDADIRSRLNAVYTVAMFAGGGAFSALVGLCWAAGGWPLLCGLGLLPVLLAAAIAATDRGG